MITIKNLHNEQPKNPWDIRIDRASILGNPFRMSNALYDARNYVCNLYHKRFYAIVKNNVEFLQKTGITPEYREHFMQELRRLYHIHKQYGKLNLFCWCAPKRCHAETIKSFLEKFINKEVK